MSAYLRKVAIEFAMTTETARRNVQDRDGNLARHLIISFKPNEITDPQMAHEIGNKIAEAALKGKYEYVLSARELIKKIWNTRKEPAGKQN